MKSSFDLLEDTLLLMRKYPGSFVSCMVLFGISLASSFLHLASSLLYHEVLVFQENNIADIFQIIGLVFALVNAILFSFIFRYIIRTENHITVNTVSKWRFIWRMIVLQILLYIFIFGGYVLLLIPGLYILLLVPVSIGCLIDKDLKPFAALKEAYLCVYGRWWKIFGRICTMVVFSMPIVIFGVGIATLSGFFNAPYGYIILCAVGLLLYAFIQVFHIYFYIALYQNLKNLEKLTPTHINVKIRRWVWALSIGVGIAITGLLSNFISTGVERSIQTQALESLFRESNFNVASIDVAWISRQMRLYENTEKRYQLFVPKTWAFSVEDPGPDSYELFVSPIGGKGSLRPSINVITVHRSHPIEMNAEVRELINAEADAGRHLTILSNKSVNVGDKYVVKMRFRRDHFDNGKPTKIGGVVIRQQLNEYLFAKGNMLYLLIVRGDVADADYIDDVSDLIAATFRPM